MIHDHRLRSRVTRKYQATTNSRHTLKCTRTLSDASGRRSGLPCMSKPNVSISGVHFIDIDPAPFHRYCRQSPQGDRHNSKIGLNHRMAYRVDTIAIFSRNVNRPSCNGAFLRHCRSFDSRVTSRSGRLARMKPNGNLRSTAVRLPGPVPPRFGTNLLLIGRRLSRPRAVFHREDPVNVPCDGTLIHSDERRRVCLCEQEGRTPHED